MIYAWLEKPNDRRGFVHKRIIGAATGFVGGGFQGAIRGALTSGGRSSVSARTRTARSSPTSAAQKAAGRRIKLAAGMAPTTTALSVAPHQPRPLGGIGGRALEIARRAAGLDPGCNPPLVVDVDGVCRFPTSPADISVGGAIETGVGQAVMGRYGAALRPGNMVVNRAVCLKGMVVADDGLCYNRSQVANRSRMWPKGRRPLLTGGDMRAIAIAARAGRSLERAQKRLQKIGLMKKPPPRKRITSGPTEHHHHT